jgi:cell division protein FtsB
VRAFLIGLAVVAATLVHVWLDEDAGIRTWVRLERDLRAARSRIAALRTEVAELERAAADLRGDPFALERAIREDLDLVRPGEVLIRLPEREDVPPVP